MPVPECAADAAMLVKSALCVFDGLAVKSRGGGMGEVSAARAELKQIPTRRFAWTEIGAVATGAGAETTTFELWQNAHPLQKQFPPAWTVWLLCSDCPVQIPQDVFTATTLTRPLSSAASNSNDV
ncbi:MAG TPA: hypothetical protein VH595_20505 [Verrucomicrobiae bacterium]|nr:hypothetical protein [Verrucomicrobiae bacterium]